MPSYPVPQCYDCVYIKKFPTTIGSKASCVKYKKIPDRIFFKAGKCNYFKKK